MQTLEQQVKEPTVNVAMAALEEHRQTDVLQQVPSIIAGRAIYTNAHIHARIQTLPYLHTIVVCRNT